MQISNSKNRRKRKPIDGVKAIVFDLDNTLIESGINFRGMKTSIINLFVNMGVASNLLNESMLNLEIIKASEEYLSKKMSKERVKEILKKADEIMNKFEMESLRDARLMKDTIDVLKFLDEMGFKIGIVTNGCRKYAEKIINMFGLGKHVDALVARDDVSHPKPDPRHLQHILNILNVSAEEAVFIGDHWIDAICAKRAKVPFILFSKEKRGFEKVSLQSPHIVINSLGEIITLIHRIPCEK
ncbi:HAD family hydrolase [Candidatus Bathyarchaeota archaeon]|nr:HAD family hydrolase [Candidatus Bathyarchaeota archaeon]